MRRVLIVSPHSPSRRLLARMLEEAGVEAYGVADSDVALEEIARSRPAVLLVDSRRVDEDHALLVGLLRRRYPKLALISLLPGCVRVLAESGKERVYDVRASQPDDLGPLLTTVQRVTKELLADHLIAVLRPATALA